MTEYKQLCAELVELGSSPARSVSELAERMSQVMDLADRARAALAEPEPEEPTDIEIASVFKAYAVIEPQMGASRILHEKHFSNAAHAILARWGK